MDKELLAKLKRRLLDEKESLLASLEENNRYNLENQMSESFSEFSMYDNHPADIGTEMFEREKDIALYFLDRETMRQIDQALSRMEDGSYGYCSVCGQPIPAERLEAIPHTLTCKEHAPAPDVNDQRPIEEQIEMPPFGRSSLDERDDTNAFDGEDTWQIVENWGTSSTPWSYEDNDKTDYNDMMIESGEPDGFVEPVEQIAYTDIHGYHGPDSVHFNRGFQYEAYMEKGEGKGNSIRYEEYLRELEDQDGAGPGVEDISNGDD
ncbi:TraR/DksA C4-type zinc finger protein [Brevibacillus massiliensis]|uniref:TraR/DksA C4-type zinc finger protein n=1 Tax=Brevibacillus massiliensis TaxID=1118054 RepID=UPI0002D8D839|nr:TraR/DksA C4-type zinc finger protein [Brevibacillus massiliensis]